MHKYIYFFYIYGLNERADDVNIRPSGRGVLLFYAVAFFACCFCFAIPFVLSPSSYPSVYIIVRILYCMVAVCLC